MYYLRYRSADYHHPTLVEMTAKEMREETAKSAPTGWPYYERITSDSARRLVANGAHHETALYVDDIGRVRYARDGY